MPKPLQGPLETLLATKPSEPFVRTLARLAQEKPDAPLFTFGDTTLTRAEFAARSNQMARVYTELGVGVGDFVTIGLPNSLDWYVHRGAPGPDLPARGLRAAAGHFVGAPSGGRLAGVEGAHVGRQHRSP
jgi:hypothetical protein